MTRTHWENDFDDRGDSHTSIPSLFSSAQLPEDLENDQKGSRLFLAMPIAVTGMGCPKPHQITTQFGPPGTDVFLILCRERVDSSGLLRNRRNACSRISIYLVHVVECGPAARSRLDVLAAPAPHAHPGKPVVCLPHRSNDRVGYADHLFSRRLLVEKRNCCWWWIQ